jgi:hypothetical protein
LIMLEGVSESQTPRDQVSAALGSGQCIATGFAAPRLGDSYAVASLSLGWMFFTDSGSKWFILLQLAW